MSKIAISSEGPTLEDLLDPRFGRAGGFVLYDPETKKTEYINNGTAQSMAQGAGIQAAETVAKAGAKLLLTGYVGPKAFKALCKRWASRWARTWKVSPWAKPSSATRAVRWRWPTAPTVNKGAAHDTSRGQRQGRPPARLRCRPP